jgi:endoglycosylceramidase
MTSVRNVVVFIALALACQQGAPAPFSVFDGDLHDEYGRVMILHGANMAGANKLPPYFGFQQAPDIARMSNEWGMNAMRLLTTWAAIEPARGAFDETYLFALEERVKWAADAGMVVVVDMHQDLYGEGFAGGDGAPKWTCDASHYAAFTPTTPWFFGSLDPNVEACVDGLYHDESVTSEFVLAWQHVAAHLYKYPNVVGFDPLNEPGWGSEGINGYEADTLAPFYERVVDAVRVIAPQWIAFIEPGASRNLGLPTGLPPPDYPNVVYAPHSYDSAAEQGNAFDPNDRGAILSNATSLRAEADALGAALWVGEYGTQTNLSGATDYMTDELDAFDAVGAGATYWAYDEDDDGYGLLNSDGSEKTALLAIVTRPYPERVAGTNVQYAWDSTARALTLTYTPNREILAPTLVSVAPAFAPVTVSCGDCTYDFEAPGVRITTPPSEDTATIVITSAN